VNRRLLVLAAILLLTGCAGMMERATERLAGDLESAIREYDDPATVADALPAYLLLLEARLQSSPDSASLRLTTARLTASHAALFGSSTEASARRLTRRALEHARSGACLEYEPLCDVDTLTFPDFEARLKRLSDEALVPAYVLATTWVGWIDAHSGDYSALADLPRVEALLDWIAARSPEHDDGAVWLYLAVLHSQRPPAAGGRPELARRYFERSREVSDGRNLLIDVMLADHYARLLFDRDLFVRALERVVASEVEAAEYRLVNAVARQRARELLDQTERIFD
jgi:hypothetical protein